MRFRTKILISNMIVVSLVFALCGTMLIYDNYSKAIKQEIRSECDKNQILKVALETKVVNLLLKEKYEGAKSLASIELLNNYNIDSDYCILDKTLTPLSGKIHSNVALTKLVEEVDKGSGYYIYEEKDTTSIMTANIFHIQNEKVILVNSKNISHIYNDINEQIKNFKIMFVAVLSICYIIMYFIAFALTKSIMQLHKVANELSDGNFQIRSKVTTKDEIGDLKNAFNFMADSIQNHINELEESVEKKEEFVANFTHEIKTPLTSIIGYADLIRMDAISDETKILSANYIYSEGVRLENLSMKLFDLILLGKESITTKQIWVTSLIEEVDFIVRPMLKKDGIHFICEPIEACIMGDYEMLKTVFINLIDNARKASKHGETIHFSAKREDKNICYTIEDNGIGIPEDEINKITEAFYMVDKSRARIKGGAGLGLALVNKIVDLHNGQMKINSKLGEGTKIQIILEESSDTSVLDLTCTTAGEKRRSTNEE